MKKLAIITASGFAISFAGSVPLGYLNLIGYEVLKNGSFQMLIGYLSGVVAIEAVVIAATLAFAKILSSSPGLLKGISWFSIIFLIVLAFVTWTSPEGSTLSQQFSPKGFVAAVFLGLTLSALNFVQIPFWLGWNLYLESNKTLSADAMSRTAYILSAIAGTFCGMLVLIFSIFKLSGFSSLLRWFNVVIPLVFLMMAAIQGWKLFQKYYRRGA